MNMLEPTPDTRRPPTQHLGMSRVDGCPECVLNVEAPVTSIPLSENGYRNLYTCSDCGHTWATEWGS